MIFNEIIDTAAAVNDYLSKFNTDNFSNKLRKIIFDYIDNPYKFIALEIEKNNQPSYNLFLVDCTTFVVNVYSLTLSKDYDEFIKNYTKLFYYSNEIRFDTRIHFTEDRIINSVYFKKIEIPKLNVIRDSAELILNQKIDNTKLIDIDFSKKIKIEYYAFNEKNAEIINDFFMNNNEILGICFVRKKHIKDGHFIAHEGFVVDDLLVHSSREKGKVCAMKDFSEYMKAAKFDGFLLFTVDLSKFAILGYKL